MNVCLVTSPRYNSKPTYKALAPMGLAYLAAVARDAGHNVTAIEGVFLGNPTDIARKVASANPDVVGTSTSSSNRLAGIASIREIRQATPNAFIVVGGSHFSHTAENALRCIPEIDAVVVGEGEQTFLELLEHLPDRDALATIPGLVFRDDENQIVRNKPRQVMSEINSLPRPAWDIFSLDQYSFPKISGDSEQTVGVLTTRGCPQQCVFCANSLNKKMRFLDPALAVDQLEWLHNTFGINDLYIYDDDFLTSKKHAVSLCEELLKRNTKFSWLCTARAKQLDFEVLKLIRKAGCKCISFGVETGTNTVLKASKKNLTVEQIYEAMEIVSKVHFDKVDIFLIIGLPGETTETIDQTVDFLKTIRALFGKSWQVKKLIGQPPLIYPGTELEDIGRKEGCLPENFSWNQPYLQPKRYLPLINKRYQTVPYFETRSLSLEDICAHLRKRHWNELSKGQKRNFRHVPLRRLKVALGID